MKATYKLRDEIQNCRSPFLSNAEFPVDWNYGPGPHSPAADARAFDYAYKNRFTHVLNSVQEFDAHTLEAESIWGSNVRSKTDELRRCVRELYAAISAVVFDKANSGQDFESDKEFGRRMRGVISTAEPENTNVFSQRINAAIHGIEGQIRPHLPASRAGR